MGLYLNFGAGNSPLVSLASSAMGLRKKASHSISLLSVFTSASRMLPSACFTLNMSTRILPPSVGSQDMYLWAVQTDLSSRDTKKSSQCAFLAHLIMLPCVSLGSPVCLFSS